MNNYSNSATKNPIGAVKTEQRQPRGQLLEAADDWSGSGESFTGPL